jgi:hypothetical protein
MSLPRLYTPEEVAEALGLNSINWLEETARRRQIPHTRIARQLRFTREQFDHVVSSCAVHTPTVSSRQVQNQRGVVTNPEPSVRLSDLIRAELD